jgi:hypothetical protein
MQRAVVASHTRPDAAAPQSASVAQPHEPPETQRAPPRSARQALWLVAVHSTHVFVPVAQTNGAGQSLSRRHCTQVSTLSVVSQRGKGDAQSASAVQPRAVAQWPTPAETPTQVAGAGQPLWLGPQPGTQKPFGPLQIRPELAAPQVASLAHPQRPVATMHWGWRPPHRL